MIERKKEPVISAVLVMIMAVLVGFNVFLVEKTGAEARKITEALEKIDYMQSKIKEAETGLLKQRMARESVEILEFDEEYRIIRDEYIEKANALSKKLNSKFINIDEIKELTDNKMDLSREFKEKLGRLHIPRSLEDFYNFKMEFLDSDIRAMDLVLAYYDSGDYSTYDNTGLEEAYEKSYSLFLKAEEEMEMVYREYALEYLLEQ